MEPVALARGRKAGVVWLLECQRAGGGWAEQLYAGTVFPLSALGRYVRTAEAGPS